MGHNLSLYHRLLLCNTMNVFTVLLSIMYCSTVHGFLLERAFYCKNFNCVLASTKKSNLISDKPNNVLPKLLSNLRKKKVDDAGLPKHTQNVAKLDPVKTTQFEVGFDDANNNFKSGFVSILGNPNVGKSTLMNALLGQKLSIVSPKPQTTRHSIVGLRTTSDYQLAFVDTPGIISKPAYKLQDTMISATKEALDDAEVYMIVTDVFGEELHDQSILRRISKVTSPVIVVVNKVDLLQNSTAKAVKHPIKPKEELTNLWKELLPNAEVMFVSALKSSNVTELLNKLIGHLPKGPKYYPSEDLSDRDERFCVTELIRESLFECCQDEIPYSCEVVIDSFKDKPQNNPKLSVVTAAIVTAKPVQKSMIIGKGGEGIKTTATKSRLKIEEFLDRKVYLDLTVRVDADWRSKRDSLVNYGYIEDD